ncbi:uncharacterized protein C8R40DRAFT_1166431 [Lentinula edodes]|uniref:uncharacterized protein n=1 Tax=Lentinula edodes TaxID=5353 RepID=UPI001E8E2EDB|nr:uncharacterized protein C8R40DRAFT_1166431 [Lentinula edodes]KAH7879179.1 hypothetical protein C8R40DRAFT_1166431 [Lentinula edodes]
MSAGGEEISGSVGDELYYNVINLICFAVLYGVFLSATLIALRLLLFPSDPKPHSTRRLLLLFTLAIFIVNTIDFLDTFEPLFILTKRTLVVPLSGGLPEQLSVAQNSITPWVKLSSWPPTLNLCIGDLLVVWRAIAIWNGNQPVKWGLIFLMIVNGGKIINFAQAVLSEISSVDPVRTRQTNAASLDISLATNAIATGLIALKFWNYRRSVRSVLGRDKFTEVQNLLSLLVESGAIFLMLQLTMAVLLNLDIDSIESQSNAFQTAYTIMEEVFEETCCLYPVAVVLMINLQSSVVDATIHSEGSPAQQSVENSSSRS